MRLTGAKWDHDPWTGGKFDHLAKSAGHRHDSAGPVWNVFEQARFEWRLAEGMVGTHAELLVGIHAELLVGIHAELLVGTHAEVLVGTHEMKLSSSGQLLEEVPQMQSSVVSPSLRHGLVMVPPPVHLSCTPRRPRISRQLWPEQGRQQRQ